MSYVVYVEMFEKVTYFVLQMKDIRRVCRDVGVSGNGTKMDCIVRLHKKIRSTDKYRKIFNNVVGTSGKYCSLI